MKKLLTLLLLASTSFTFGQYYYTVSSSPGNPGGVMTTDEFTNPSAGGGWTAVLNSGATAWSAPQTIPFTFEFNGNVVSQYVVSPNGVVSFDVSASTVPGAPTSLPSANLPDNSIAAWGWEMSGSNDEVAINTLGTAGSQQHWIFFTSMTQVSDPSCWYYYGIVFEEGTNNIFVVDMRNSCPVTALTIGVQIDGSTAFEVAGSPTLAGLGGTGATAVDNYYYTFVPGVQAAYDMAGVSMTGAAFNVLANGPFDITGVLSNLGSATITTMDINYRVNSGAVVTAPLTGLSIPTNDSYSFTHPTPWGPATIGTYTVEVWASNLNGNPDANTANDIASGDMDVLDNVTQRIPLYETFTSSTCGPCTPANALLEGLFNDPSNAGKFTSIKYQMSWPGTGDPYYTTEGNNRRTDYAINSIPRLELDGGWDQNANNVTQQLMDQWALIPAFVDMSLTYSVNGQGVWVDVTIDPVATISSNLRLYIAVFEYETFNNVKTNGEVEFFHVMKKMLPNDNGSTLPQLTAGQQQTHFEQYDFQGSYRLSNNANDPINHSTEHSVEEFSDLGVVAWLQDPITMEVHQSTTGTVVVGVEEEDRLFVNAKIFPNPTRDMATLALNLSNKADNFTVSVYDNAGKLVSQQAHGTIATGRNNVNLDTQSLESGLYLVRISSGAESMTLNMSVIR